MLLLAQAGRSFGFRPSSEFKIENRKLALEFDLACQFVLNRYDIEIEKMRLSVWGVPKSKKIGQPPESKTKPPELRKQKMTAKEIMKAYK